MHVSLLVLKVVLNALFMLSDNHQAILETVARVKSKKNDTKEDKYVFSLVISFFKRVFLFPYNEKRKVKLFLPNLSKANASVILMLGHLNSMMFSIWIMRIEQKICLH